MTDLVGEAKALTQYLRARRAASDITDDQMLTLLSTTTATLAMLLSLTRHEALSDYATTLATVYKRGEERSKLPPTR
jgi:hypothetical protein